jgi:hypothetical protein
MDAVTESASSARDFDFRMGHWNVRNRVLREVNWVMELARAGEQS